MNSKSEKEIIRIGLDAMGGDHSPEAALKGANIFISNHENVEFNIFGNESKISPILDELKELKKISTIIHTEDIIASDDKPSTAIRKGKNSSMALAIKSAKAKKSDCVVSAGNTGALMAMSKIFLRTLPGIDRPAIGGIMPTSKGDSVMLDLGANLSCDANNLFEFAVMGDAFARSLLGIESPSIGLLNIGTEEIKGNEAIKSAALMIKDANTSLNFYGFIEGNDIGKRTVDVVVTDGFSGNIALKTAEGTALMLSKALKDSMLSSFTGKIGALLCKNAFKEVKNNFDPRLHNGAMLLGLNGIVVKSHGGSDEIGNSNAIKVAFNLTKHKINEQIIKEMIDSGHISPEDENMPYLNNEGK